MITLLRSHQGASGKIRLARVGDNECQYGLVWRKRNAHHFPMPPDRLRSGSHPTPPPRAGAKLRPRKMLRSMEKWRCPAKWKAALGVGREPLSRLYKTANFDSGKPGGAA